MSSAAVASVSVSSGTSLFGLMFLAMFFTGNCNSCNERDQDYIDQSIKAAERTVTSFSDDGLRVESD
jgi:hypothetical protein